MARLTSVDPAQATGKARELFDGPLKGKHFNIFKAMANSGAVLDMYVAMSSALKNASLSAAEQETIQLAVGAANSCDYCQAAHTAIGKSAGLSETQTIEARRGELSDSKLNALARFAIALHEKRGNVSDEDIQQIRSAGYEDAHIAEAVAVYALATFTNFLNHVNQTPVDFPAPPEI